MPSTFGIRKHIRELFHHSLRKSGKADLPATTEYHPSNNRIPPSAPIPPQQAAGTSEPFELHHSFLAPDHLNIIGTSSYRPPGEGEPLGADLDFPPNNYSTIQSVLPSPEPGLNPLGDLGPRPSRKTEPHTGECLVHPDSEIPATPSGEEAHTELSTEGYISPRSDSAGQQGKKNSNRILDIPDLPPEAINVLPEPPRLEIHSSDKASLAFKNVGLRRLSPRRQQSPSSSICSLTHQDGVEGEKERPSSVDSESVYNRKSVSESVQGSNALSGHLNCLKLPGVGKHMQERCESPVLGWPKHRSEHAAMVDPLTLSHSQEVLEGQKDGSSRYVDSGFWERKHTLEAHALDECRRENAQPAPEQLRLSQGQGQPSIYQGNEALRPYTPTSVARQSPIITELLPAYHHDTQISCTHVPPVTHSIDKHVSYNSPIIHERTIPQRREIRRNHIIRDIHTHEVKTALQPVVKPEYLSPKHVVQLESGETSDITTEEATSGNYSVLSTENRVLTPASVRNMGELF